MKTTSSFRCAGLIEAKTTGWKLSGVTADDKGMAFNPAEGWYPSKGDSITSPHIPCEPWKYYHLSLRSKAEKDGYWSIVFFDANGESIVDDIYSRIYASQDWMENSGIARGRESAKTLTIRFSADSRIDVKDIVFGEATTSQVLAWSDNLMTTLPPLTFAPPAGRLERLSNTLRRLQKGGVCRMVLLGDSIMNDTNNSNFEALLSEKFPKALIRVIASVRGSTGCWHYQDPKYFHQYVRDKRPDLLMIGGISHRKEIGPIRRVIQMAKKQVPCEILMMSGPVGKDWRSFDNSGEPIPTPWPGEPFNKELATMAEEEEVAYFDIGAAWHEYLATSGKPFQWFQRDLVHADDRGKQVLARLIEGYF
ncbi:MAG: SGNH/GDSL hydrolase family protein [Spirochaetia bacterium]|nr:SGNH/GDSL hydrolase family protein [Spirochaetia bacterium]